jgi:hypothetical protein
MALPSPNFPEALVSMVIWKSVDKSVYPAKKRIEPSVENKVGRFVGKPKFIDTKTSEVFCGLPVRRESERFF